MDALYEGKLKLQKQTNQMLVYGDDVLRAQYIPKVLFPDKGKSAPDEIEIVIRVQVQSSPGKKRK